MRPACRDFHRAPARAWNRRILKRCGRGARSFPGQD